MWGVSPNRGFLAQLPLVMYLLRKLTLATSFQLPRGWSEQQRVKLIRQAKLLRIPLVDSVMEHQVVFCLDISNNSSSNNSRSSSSSTYSSNNTNISILANHDHDDDDMYMSGGYTTRET